MLVVVQTMLQVYASVVLESEEELSAKEESLLNTVISSRCEQWEGILRGGLLGDSAVCSTEEFLRALQVFCFVLFCFVLFFAHVVTRSGLPCHGLDNT